MHVEPRHAPPTSLKEFGREYAMIVLSILTALSLEHGAVWLHNRDAAADSRVRIEAEIGRNLTEIDTTTRVNTDNAKAVTEFVKGLAEQERKGLPVDAAFPDSVKAAFDHFQIELPTLQHDAWDAAIADQSAGHLAQGDLQRYTEIYAAVRDIDGSAQLLLSGEWLSRASDLGVDVQLGKVERRAALLTFSRLLTSFQQISGNLKSLRTLMAKGRPGEAASTPPAP